jgi:HEPN domain-containing protein
MVDQSIVTEWISKGEEDYNFARANLEEGKNFFAQICFHFQQAAEKYLKAFIIASDLEFRRIHDLGLLLKVCSAKDTSFEDLRETCDPPISPDKKLKKPSRLPSEYGLL